MSMLQVPSEAQGTDLLGTVTARQLTEDLRVALREVQQAAGVLAYRIRAAHEAQVWTTLGYGGWAEYAKQEFGIGRAHAYRLVHFARAAAALTAGVAAAGVWSPDEEPIGNRVLDFGVSEGRCVTSRERPMTSPPRSLGNRRKLIRRARSIRPPWKRSSKASSESPGAGQLHAPALPPRC
ncbi:hypothetical protein ACIHCQ_39345 [Streptomyces sp. NPDC052236]|uniref:hypothetical protein n=1 Tax=Streptomyces sp. NPDC052236 TaxID=3365686 RepID=UPI0037D163F0